MTLPDTLPARRLTDPVLLCVSVFALLSAAIYTLPLIWSLNATLTFGLPFDITDRDFANYWMGGRMSLAGEQQDLFIHDVYFNRLKTVFGGNYPIHSWSYPPHFLLFLWPLGFLNYTAALIAFLVSTFALFAYAVATFRQVYAPQSNQAVLILALVGYVLMMLAATQNGFLTAAALLCGLAWMKQRPVLAGLAFAFLTVKPQLGFLIPVLLLFDRNWSTIRWSVLFTVALVVLSIALFGVDSWHAYLTETLAYQRSVMTDWYGIFLRMMPTVFGSMRTLGFSPPFALVAQWPVTIFAAVLVVGLLWKEADPLRRIFVVTCGTFLITPYAFNYDMGALSVVAAVLVGSDRAPASRPARIVIAVIAALAGVITNLGRTNLPIAPLILTFGLLAITLDTWRRAGMDRSAPAAESGHPDPNETATA